MESFFCQVALAGTSYSLLQRVGAIVVSPFKIGTGITNALIKTRKAVDKEFAGEAEDVPIVSTSVAYGVYMAVSSNLRYEYKLSHLLWVDYARWVGVQKIRE
ncbi:hypothetical protein GW17_00003193 [Ensete ventricosum]|nr:hypothetical protein GW17_00003193 [Ensete ventricosum]